MLIDHKLIHNTIRKVFHLSNRTLRGSPRCASMRYPREFLGVLFKELGYKCGAEIGVRRGQFSEVLLKANPDLIFHCVDPWAPYPGRRYTKEIQDGIYKQARKRLEGYNVNFIREKSLDAVKKFTPNSLDFVFIDGDHRFASVVQDICQWEKVVRPGGIISVHDYLMGELGVFMAVEGFVRSYNIQPYYCTKEPMPTAFWVKL